MATGVLWGQVMPMNHACQPFQFGRRHLKSGILTRIRCFAKDLEHDHVGPLTPSTSMWLTTYCCVIGTMYFVPLYDRSIPSNSIMVVYDLKDNRCFSIYMMSTDYQEIASRLRIDCDDIAVQYHCVASSHVAVVEMNSPFVPFAGQGSVSGRLDRDGAVVAKPGESLWWQVWNGVLCAATFGTGSPRVASGWRVLAEGVGDYRRLPVHFSR